MKTYPSLITPPVGTPQSSAHTPPVGTPEFCTHTALTKHSEGLNLIKGGQGRAEILLVSGQKSYQQTDI